MRVGVFRLVLVFFAHTASLTSLDSSYDLLVTSIRWVLVARLSDFRLKEPVTPDPCTVTVFSGRAVV